MKILLINKFLFPKGGDAVYTLNLGKLLLSKGHRVMYWGMQHPENPEYEFSEYFVANVDYSRPGWMGRKIVTAFNMLYSLEAKKRIEKLIKREKPDIVHLNNFAHQISPSILDVFKRYKIPVVMTMHDYKLVCPAYSLLCKGKPCEQCARGAYDKCFWNKCVKNRRLKSLLSTIEMYLHHKILKIYNCVDVFIAPSRFLKDKLAEMGFQHPVECIPNFLDQNAFRAEYKWEKRSIVCFGRLSHEKGLFTLIKAMSGFPDVTLTMIGEGPVKADLKAFAADAGITNVVFPGFVVGEELKNIIRSSMFAVIASECYDNNPLSVLEAFALGKPVVGSCIGGIPEMILDNVTGLTFEAGNVQDLREKIKYMLDHPGEIETMGRNARSFIEEKRNAEEYYKNIMAIYNRCLNAKN
jgi:glycosyltransferase involved in cell wall biosynthesis